MTGKLRDGNAGDQGKPGKRRAPFHSLHGQERVDNQDNADASGQASSVLGITVLARSLFVKTSRPLDQIPLQFVGEIARMKGALGGAHAAHERGGDT